MKHSELIDQFYLARKLYIKALKLHVKTNGGVVECDQTERRYVSDFDRYYQKRIKYISLTFEGRELKVKYLENLEQEDIAEPGGGWEEYNDPIDYFSMDEIFDITNDIIYKD